MAEREWRLLRNEPRQAIDEIRVELDNVRLAWRWAVQNRTSLALKSSAVGLWQFYLWAGLSPEGALAFRQAAIALQDSAASTRAELHTQPQALVSKLWALSAHLLRVHGNYEEAIDVAQRAIALAGLGQFNVSWPDAVPLVGNTLGKLAWGQTLFYQGQFSQAQLHIEQALKDTLLIQNNRTPDEVWLDIEIQARVFLGAIARIDGAYAFAKRYLVDCLQRCRQLQKVRGEVHSQLNLGYTAWLMRELQSARQAYEQVLPLMIALRDRWGEGVARHELAQVMRSLGEYSSALALCQQALPIVAEINERFEQVCILTLVIELYSCMGQFESAGNHQAYQVTLLQHVKTPDLQRVALVSSTIMAHCQGNYKQALQLAQQLWQVAQPTKSTLYQAEALILLGQAQSALQLQATAIESYTQALTLYQQLDSPDRAAEAQAGLASIALAQGDYLLAQQFTEAVLSTLEQIPNAGLYEPFLIYLTCYQVLTVTHDPRADSLLQRAYALLQQYAAHIYEEEMRESFLQNVAVHRQLVMAYEEATKSALYD